MLMDGPQAHSHTRAHTAGKHQRLRDGAAGELRRLTISHAYIQYTQADGETQKTGAQVSAEHTTNENISYSWQPLMSL